MRNQHDTSMLRSARLEVSRVARSVVAGSTIIAALCGFSQVAAASTAADQHKSAARTGAGSATPADDDASVAHVLNRLAFGPAPGDFERVKRIGIDRYIDEQLDPDRIALPDDLTRRLAALDVQRLPAGTLIAAFREDQRAVRQARRNRAQALPMQPADAMKTRTAADDALAARREQYRRLAYQSAEARLIQAIESPRQLQEVMTDFWFNHFNVFAGKGLDRVLVSNYERDAIRPYALGRFRDLLGATAKHPAMLFYLDNWLSTGANAEVNRGAARQAGLNENYARELMELHTLGVGSQGKPGDRIENYTQKDVTELARMLTGWTFDGRPVGRAGPISGVESRSLFVFAPRRHDNGTKQWLGHRIAPDGQQEGEYALDVLAMHPATAQHLSFELAQYFVADRPPQALVDRMAARYLVTGGDIREVLRTLFYSPEFRDPRTFDAKFKTPYQYVVSAVRASAYPVVNVQPLVATLAQLGMPLYGCQTPDGYKNTEAAWLNPEGMTRRINFATALASGRSTIDREPPAFALPAPAMQDAGVRDAWGRASTAVRRATQPAAESGALPVLPLLATLGPAIGDKTRRVALDSDPRLAAALVLGSPDFMRR